MIGRFIWRARYALRLRSRGDFPFRLGFSISSDAYAFDPGACPIDAADEELTYWADD